MCRKIIGITGSFGTGKSTVAKIFANFGAVVIDADKIAHQVIMPKEAVYRKIVSLFGSAILNKNKTINRKKLAKVVFSDERKLKLLNSLVHPEVIKRIKEIVKKRHKKDILVIDAPLLIESGLHNIVDKLIVVTAKRDTQIKRCIKRRVPFKDVIKRIRSQMPISAKKELADYIIDNNGSINLTKKKVKRIWEEIKDGSRRNKNKS